MLRQWNDVFRSGLGKADRSYVGELQEARNDWAHDKEFTIHDAERIADTATRLLEAIGAVKETEITRSIMKELRRLSYEAEEQQVTKPAAPRDIEAPTTARERLSQTTHEAIKVQIMRGVAILVLQKGQREFSRADIWETLGVNSQKQASYNPIFQGMRVDQPGGAPNVGAKFKGVFRRLEHGKYALTEYGNRLLLTEFIPRASGIQAEQAIPPLRVGTTSVLEFDNDEEEYLHWVDTNPNGYVINAPKRRGDFPDVLHKASCRHISTDGHKNYTTTDFKKLCSLDKQALLEWGTIHSDDFRKCQHCKP